LNDASSPPTAPARSFAALHHPGYRGFFLTSAIAMMADSIEHVISYWIIHQKFHSPWLGGFAQLSHWLPFLFFSIYAGALADRFDVRRLTQLGMVLFMVASVGWGVLFLTDSLEVWHAVVLLTIHGFAGVLWAPAGQILIHDILGPAQLQSGIRLIAISRQLGLLAGPAVGGVIMAALGPAYGILFNALIYVPVVVWLQLTKYGARHPGQPAPARGGSWQDFFASLRMIASNRVIMSMTLLTGAVSLFVSNAYQAQMGQFAEDLGGHDAHSYSMLFAADALGALIAGLVLESTGFLRARILTVFALVLLWCAAITGFALAPSYTLALGFLFIAGFLSLAYQAMAQTLVQLNAPPEIRGRVLGVFNTSSLGLRAFSGVSVGFVGGMVGSIHWSLAASAVTLAVVTLLLAWIARRPVSAGSPVR
jgi:MFS family permease